MPLTLEQRLENIFTQMYNHPTPEALVLRMGFWDDLDWTFWVTVEDVNGRLLAESELGITLDEALDQIEKGMPAAIAAAKEKVS